MARARLRDVLEYGVGDDRVKRLVGKRECWIIRDGHERDAVLSVLEPSLIRFSTYRPLRTNLQEAVCRKSIAAAEV
jgi:hypothetical protein